MINKKFKTQKQLDSYFSEDESIQCLICNRQMKRLGYHLSIAHGMSTKEYKIEYGIPMKYGLVCRNLSKTLSDNAQANIKYLDKFTPEQRSLYGRMGVSAAKASDSTRGNHSEVTNKKYKKIQKEKLTPASKGKIAEMQTLPDTPTNCYGCNAETTITAINKWRGIKAFCSNCKREKQNAAQRRSKKKWCEEDPEGRKKYFREKAREYRAKNKKPKKDRTGDNSPLTKLTNQDAVNIYKEYHNSGQPHGIVRNIARKYQVSEGVIHSILKGRTFKTAIEGITND